MRVDDFDFELPSEQIAQYPLAERDASRLMRVERSTGAIADHAFAELPSLLRPGDLLVVNDSRVIPARLLGKKAGTGGRVELLLVRPTVETMVEALECREGPLDWVCLGQASKGLRPEAELTFDAGIAAHILEALGAGEYRVRLFWPAGQAFAEVLALAGRLPLPPYITREPTSADAARYQTVFARAAGSVAAPTAGLHFTNEVLSALAERGVHRASLTLDVGPGTFLPVREQELDRHKMHDEHFHIPEATAEAIGLAKAEGRRVVAVGTTVVRALESAALDDAPWLRSGSSSSALFIRPGFRFRIIDALLTNFHLPRSTLLMLVSAFLGTERTLAAYREAVRRHYRFFSYGDAMLIGDMHVE